VNAREVTLNLPPDRTLLRVVRLAASGLASDLGFTVRELDDLALAVDELTLALMEVARSDISLSLRADGMGVSVRGSAGTGGTIELSDLATSILTSACDLYEIGQGMSGPFFSMVKVRENID